MSETRPDCPDNWIVSTAQPTHLSLLYRPDGRSLLILPTEPAAASTDPETIEAWTVTGVAGYGPRYPIFAAAVARDEAIATAESVMATVANGDEPTPLRVSDRRAASKAATTDTDSHNATDDKTDDQAALSAFADESDDAD